MEIVTTTSVFPDGYPAETALTRLADVGYTCLDLAFDYCVKPGFPFREENWKNWAENLKAMAEARGIRYTHAHSCGNAASRSPETLRCFEACRILDIRYIVMHPVTGKPGGGNIDDEEEFIRVNAEAIRPLLPYAEENGVIILSENILWGASIKPTVIADLVKAVDHPNFGWCFDTGHIHCCGVPMSELRKVAVPPLSLHIQDNHGAGSGDEHLLPGDGTIDWKEFMDILAEIGYRGDVVLEAHHQSIDAPDEEREKILEDLLSRAEKMRDYMTSGN